MSGRLGGRVKGAKRVMVRGPRHRSDVSWVRGGKVEGRVIASGEEPYRAPAGTGRNEPCPCGSGKKYKRCCA